MSQTLEPEIKPTDDLGFDPVALKKKYLAERDKRLKADGNEQYREVKGEFARYLDCARTNLSVGENDESHQGRSRLGCEIKKQAVAGRIVINPEERVFLPSLRFNLPVHRNIVHEQRNFLPEH